LVFDGVNSLDAFQEFTWRHQVSTQQCKVLEPVEIAVFADTAGMGVGSFLLNSSKIALHSSKPGLSAPSGLLVVHGHLQDWCEKTMGSRKLPCRLASGGVGCRYVQLPMAGSSMSSLMMT